MAKRIDDITPEEIEARVEWMELVDRSTEVDETMVVQLSWIGPGGSSNCGSLPADSGNGS